MFSQILESLAVKLVRRTDMLAKSSSIVVVMNIVVVVAVAKLGVTEIRWAMWAFSIATSAISTSRDTGFQNQSPEVAKDVQRVWLVLFCQPSMHSGCFVFVFTFWLIKTTFRFSSSLFFEYKLDPSRN